MSDTIAAGDSAPGGGVGDKDPAPKRRTAVLVVHGMGSQRALDTVRGVVKAVWLDKDGPPGEGDKRYWLHPEKKNDDVDLSVITTNDVPGTADRRSVDFHELYWAHLMSETRAVAVLLWLFQLARKGPRLKPGMRALWWGITIFLCMLVQSMVLLGLHGILQFLGGPPLISDNQILFGIQNPPNAINLWSHPYHEPEALLLAPFFVLFMTAFYSTFFSTIRGAWKITAWTGVVALLSGLFFYFGINQPSLTKFTTSFLPVVISVGVVGIAMGRWGLRAMVMTYLLSSLFFLLYLNARHLVDGPLLSLIWDKGWIFWSLNERYSAMIAFAIILIYLALYALFLQPFLGDAARYFRASPGNVLVRREIRRQAVDTLDTLHKWGTYDRIIVVAHSLGTVVAYDMLRAYFSRVNNLLPDSALLEPQFSQVDGRDPLTEIRDESGFRSAGREIVRKIAAQTVNSPVAASQKLPTWLVTDFVTLGSPLTHAHYLMCDGNTETELVEDFSRRVTQREFPVCPPEKQDGDGVLSFENKDTGKREFHHAAVFGVTRWSNLYFPMKQMFWGDAIGGPLREIFGRHIKDIPVSTVVPEKATFFTHTSYWKIAPPLGRNAPQIAELRKEVNLEDRST
jgi:pimeloyl-ACP methyl ester carboxylesterase